MIFIQCYYLVSSCAIQFFSCVDTWLAIKKLLLLLILLAIRVPSLLNNYRPISILNATSKILERIVCNQLMKHMESNNLLPNNQHGFRAQRSTMTALTSMQKEWVKSSEDGLITGVLIWDLSAAFDTVNTALLCKKLKIFLVFD